MSARAEAGLEGRARARVTELRRAFDESFRAAAVPVASETLDFARVRIAGAAFALPVADLEGVVTRRKLLPVPSRQPALVGLAGIRGAITPVYSLARLLGLEGGDAAAPWLVLCRASDSFAMALAFDGLDGFLRAPRADVAGRGGAGGASGRYLREVVHADGAHWMIVDVRAVGADLRLASRSSS